MPIPACAATVPIFRALPAEGLEELGRAMRHRAFARGERVVGTGEPVTHMIVVARGRLKLVHTTSSGREQVVRTLGPGEFLGEMALFAPATHEGDLIALEETEACLIARDAVQAILKKHPVVAVAAVEALARRLAEAEKLIADLGLRDVGQRLAAELLRLAGESEGAVRVRIPVPWAEMARRLGTTPESLSRRLRALVEQGMISQESGRTVVIQDLERLRLVADAPGSID
ncbi:MAG: Crp/Fnr family transcriptional regulator [Bacillota bacterium]